MMMATPGNKAASSYDGVPTSDPDIMIAVASPAVGEAIEMGNGDVESFVNCFFHDRHDIVAVFDYNITFIRETQLIELEYSIGYLCFCACLILMLVFLGNDEGQFALLFSSLGTLFVSCLWYCGSFRSFLVAMVQPTPETHTAVTTNGILHATESSSSGFGGGEGFDTFLVLSLSCLLLTIFVCFRYLETVTLEIPFTEITKVEIKIVPRADRLATTIVKVTTTASDMTPFVVRGIPTQSFVVRGIPNHVIKDCYNKFVTLFLVGLEEPYAFKQMVDSKLPLRDATVTATDALEGLVESTTNALTSRNDDSATLAQIRDELKRHNDLLEAANGQ